MWWIRQAMMHLLAETGRSAETTTAGLMAAATQSRQVEAIRVAIEYAQSAATGQDVKEPATSDAEDFAAHIREESRRRNLRKIRRTTQHRHRHTACSPPAQCLARLSELTVSSRESAVKSSVNGSAINSHGM